jgi:arylsulfatase A-like enzyme/Tfp pilus assembly protein PilF
MRRCARPLFAAVLAGLALSCKSWPPSPRPPANLLLVSIDTLRPDHLGCYGYPSARTPVLDGLAARGLRFTQATTVVPLTLPAHASLLTGTFPAHHGVRDNGGFYLGEEQTTLAETLRAKGYRTGGFVGAFVLDSRWGIAQGFDRFFDDFDLSRYEGVGMDAVQRRGDEVVAKALGWLAEDRERPFLAWVHLYDPHTPYDPPEPYRARFPPTPAGAYDGEIAWSDALVGRLLEALREDGRLAQTVVVVVGDHGESLGEHEEPTHGFFVYDATVQIPLIVAGPGVPARTVTEQVRIVDVMPTALELLGARAPKSVQGMSLLPLARGEPLSLVAYTESWHPRYHYGWSELRAVRDGRFKLIEAPRRELYDLARDPGEGQDLAGQEAAQADALQRALTEGFARLQSGRAVAGPVAVDPETEERLQALGYLGGGTSGRHLEDRPRGDPKDKIRLYNLLKRAGQDALEGRHDEAVARVREALAADPEIVEAYTLLGNVHSRAKRFGEAVAAYRRALARDPENQRATFSLALTYKEMGRLGDAAAGFERARQLDPRRGKAVWQLADIHMQEGHLGKAEAVLGEGLAVALDRPSLLQKLGECYLEMKRYPEAESRLREALGAKPDLAAVHYDLALVHEARGETARAVAEYEAELARDQKAYRASFNLGKLLLRTGRASEATRRFRQTVEAKPDFGTGYLYLAKGLLDAADLEGAREAAQKGLAAKPERSVAPLGHYVLADVYTRLGRAGEAAREVAAARRLERGG